MVSDKKQIFAKGLYCNRGYAAAERDKQHRLGTIISNLYSGVLLETNEHRIEFVNQAFCTLFNLGSCVPEELIGLTSAAVLQRIKHVYADPVAAVARIHDIVAKGEPVRREVVALSGGRLCLRDFIPLYEKGRRDGSLWNHQEITEIKRMENPLHDSEEEYRLVVKNAIEGIAVYHAGELKFANPAAERLLSCSMALDSDDHRFDPNTRPPILADEIPKTLRVGDFRMGFSCHHLKDTMGGDIWVDIKSMPLEWFGNPAELVFLNDVSAHQQKEEASKWAFTELERHVALRTAALSSINRQLDREIRERKKVERMIETSRNTLRRVVDSLVTPLVMIDSRGRIEMMNNAALSRFGVSREHMKGKPVSQVLARHAALWREVLSRKSNNDEHVTFERVSEDNRIEQIVISPAPAAKGKLTGAVVHISDITRTKLMEQRLVHTEKLASLGVLISSISHEINNHNSLIQFNIPILHDYLNSLMPIVDAYARNNPVLSFFNMPFVEFRDDLFRLLMNIEHGSERINATVAGLRTFIHKGEQIELRPVEIREVCKRAVEICRSEMSKKVKTFSMDFPDDLPMISTDPGALEQVIVNLLINAAQAADKDDSWVHLEVKRGDSWKERISIEVSDNGTGIAESEQMHVFEPFVTTKKSGEGTGLGLYICRILMEGIGGRITLESCAGIGSSFRLFLPQVD